MIYYYSRPYVEYSNGTKLSYLLVSELNNLGYKAFNLCYSGISNNTPDNYKKYVIDAKKESISINNNDIVIYPEEISDNPLHALNCVRYLLCSPMSITGQPINYGDTDYLLSYSKFINKDLPQLFILEDERNLFQNLKKTQKKDAMAFYFGKTEMNKLAAQVNNVLQDSSLFPKEKNIITRFSPKLHKDTMELLAKTKLLVSFDGFTNLNYEATLLGTPVILASDPYNITQKEFNVPLVGYYKSYKEYATDNAFASVQKAYDYYCQQIEQQSGMIDEAFKLIVKHFDKIKIDSQYASYIARRNKEQKMVDITSEKEMQNIEFESIFFPQQVPHVIKKLCGKSSSFDWLYPRKIKGVLKKVGLFKISKNIYFFFHH